MKYYLSRFIVALITFAVGVFVTSQVNRAAYIIWPDVDSQPKIGSHRPKCNVRN
jgi:hypothetical protein